VKAFPVLFAHGNDGSVMEPGVAGIDVGVIFPVDVDELLPHTFVATTETEPTPDPMVTVAEVVPCPPVNDHPVPETDQVYPVAPLTGEILYVFPVVPEQVFVGTVIVPG
jgi:hypothetical protein